MNCKSPTRVTVCTQAEFDKLPALVSLQEFLDWTGYNRSDLSVEIRAGRIKTFLPPGRRKKKYYKSEIARLGGWKM